MNIYFNNYMCMMQYRIFWLQKQTYPPYSPTGWPEQTSPLWPFLLDGLIPAPWPALAACGAGGGTMVASWATEMLFSRRYLCLWAWWKVLVFWVDTRIKHRLQYSSRLYIFVAPGQRWTDRITNLNISLYLNMYCFDSEMILPWLLWDKILMNPSHIETFKELYRAKEALLS